MVNEAEKNRAEDSKRREQVEIRNRADSMVFTAERALHDYGEKIPADTKQTIESKIEDVRKALEGSDTEHIKRAADELGMAIQQIGAAMYEPQPGMGGAPEGGGSTICAQVRLRLTQDLVLTRNAFRATLEIENRTPDTSLTNVSVRLDFFDTSGTDAAGLFAVTATNLTGLSGVDGTGILGSNTTGTAEFTILPTADCCWNRKPRARQGSPFRRQPQNNSRKR